MLNVRARRAAVKSFFRAREWAGSSDREHDAPKRLAILNPGPPGIGKSTTAVNYQIREGGALVEPTHTQAAERNAEAKALMAAQPHVAAARAAKRNERIKAQNRKRKAKGKPELPLIAPEDLDIRHMMGMGRRCLFLKNGDGWSEHGWSMRDVACDGCPKMRQCPSMRQFWDEPDAQQGVHNMATWVNGLPVVDELPHPVDTEVFDIDQLYRYTRKGWHPLVESWRQEFADDLRYVLDHIADAAYKLAPVPRYGAKLNLAKLMPAGHPVRKSLEKVIAYLDRVHPPYPPALAVRSGNITPQNWPSRNLQSLLETLIDEVDERKTSSGLRNTTMCVMVSSDGHGDVASIELQHRFRRDVGWRNQVVMDSSARWSKEIYEALFPNHEVKLYERFVPVPRDHVRLVHYDTHGLAKGRSVDFIGNLKTGGARARVRALRELLKQAALYPVTPGTRLKVGLIDHKALLEEMGFDFEKTSILTNDTSGCRPVACDDPQLERTIAQVMAEFDLTVGYHGGVTGSNQFEDCRILVLLGDPYGNIGMLEEEARTIGMQPDKYVDWSVQTRAYQEVFRARLLDASATNKKDILYFGRRPPEIEPDWEWEVRDWSKGGRLPTEQAFNLERGFYRDLGTRGAFWAAPARCTTGMHATLIGGAPLRALRESGEIIEELPRSAVETWRRAAKRVAGTLGLRLVTRPHPVPGRKPIQIYAANDMAAERLLKDYAEHVKMAPMWQKAEWAEDAPAMNADDALTDRVVEERAAIVGGLEAAAQARDEALDHALADETRTGVPADESAIHRAYRAAQKPLLARWRVIRPLLREPGTVRPRPLAETITLAEQVFGGTWTYDRTVRTLREAP